jgi:hypothetical protein
MMPRCMITSMTYADGWYAIQWNGSVSMSWQQALRTIKDLPTDERRYDASEKAWFVSADVVRQLSDTFDNYWPMWEDAKRQAAIKALAHDRYLQEALQIEPALQRVLKTAIAPRNERGYNWESKYYQLRDWAIPLVGHHARNAQLRTTQHYEAMIKAIDNLLPADDVTIWPDGKPRENEYDEDEYR